MDNHSHRLTGGNHRSKSDQSYPAIPSADEQSQSDAFVPPNERTARNPNEVPATDGYEDDFDEHLAESQLQAEFASSALDRQHTPHQPPTEPYPSPAGHRAQPTAEFSTNPTKKIAPKKGCQNCGGQHSLADCLGPLDSFGYLPGCGKCNTLQHNLADCPQGLKVNEVKHYVFKARNGKAPVIWDTDLLAPEYPAEWLSRDQPWTRNFAMRQMRSSGNVFSQDKDHRVRDPTWQQHGFDRNLIGPQLHPAAPRKRSANLKLPKAQHSRQVGPRGPAPPRRQYPGAGRATFQGSHRSQQPAPPGRHHNPPNPAQYTVYPPSVPQMGPGLVPVQVVESIFSLLGEFTRKFQPSANYSPDVNDSRSSRGHDDSNSGFNIRGSAPQHNRGRSHSPNHRSSQAYRQRDHTPDNGSGRSHGDRSRSRAMPPAYYLGETKRAMPPDDYTGRASTSHRNSGGGEQTNDFRRRGGDPNDASNQVPVQNRVKIPGQCSNCMGGTHKKGCPGPCGKCGQAGHMIWHCVKR